MSFYEPPISRIVVGALLLVGTYAAAHSARLVATGLRHAAALDLIRGIRVGIVAFVSGVIAVGVLSAETGYVILGALILGEELYETGILAVIIRLGERESPEI